MVSYIRGEIMILLKKLVLILVVMEDGLVRTSDVLYPEGTAVLILVVMEDGLVLDLIRLF